MSSSEILVIGHRNPDTDSICAALAYAEFKRATGTPGATAARCGEMTDRTAFVLETFGFDPPKLVPDIVPRVRDIMQRQILHLRPHATVQAAVNLMDLSEVRAIPILDQDDVCQGFVSIFKMTKMLCPPADAIKELQSAWISMPVLAHALEALPRTPCSSSDEALWHLIPATMEADSLPGQLCGRPPENVLLIAGHQPSLLEEAVALGIKAILLTGGARFPDNLLDAALQRQLVVLESPLDSATTLALCRANCTIDRFAHEHFISFHEDDSIEEIEPEAIASPYHLFPVFDASEKTVGVLSKTDIACRRRKRLILVDHNELSQAVPGADQSEICEVIDHHRLGHIATRQPILFRNEPVGSTCTIVAQCFFNAGLTIPQPIAGLLLAGLVSDTLNLRSPTATPQDAHILKQLEKLAGVDATEFTRRMFAVGSVLRTHSPADALVVDCKEFEADSRRFSAAHIEEAELDLFHRRKEQLMDALEEYRRHHNYYFSALMVTDIIEQKSVLLITGAHSVIRNIDFPQLEPGIFEMKNVVSRKKQLLPYLLEHLAPGASKRATEAGPLTMV